MTLDVMLLYDISDRGGNWAVNDPFGDNTLHRIKKVALRHRPDVVLLDEFRGTSYYIMENWQSLSAIAKRSGSDIVMAPEHYWSSQQEPWNKFAGKLESAGIRVEQVDEPEVPDSVGFFFSKTGMAYAFPKLWAKKPLHRIPNTDIGITICGEINHIKPELLDGISLLLNPSLEGDDPSMGVRDMIMAGYPQDTVLEQSKFGVPDVLQRIKSPPSYAGAIYAAMQERGIMALRSDCTRWQSGILSLPPGAFISEYLYMPDVPYTYLGELERKNNRRIRYNGESKPIEMNSALPLPFGIEMVRYQISNRRHSYFLNHDEQQPERKWHNVWQSEVLHLPKGWSVVRTVERPTEYTYMKIEKPSRL